MKSILGLTLLVKCLSLSQIVNPQQHQSQQAETLLGRRQWLKNGATAAAVVTGSILISPIEAALAAPTLAEVTDKVYVDIKGLPPTEGVPAGGTRRIVIGLFGKEAPNSVGKLVKLMSNEGLPATCKPKEERLLQKDQLEANKVYNSCVEGQDKGVNYDFAQIWRIIKGERIDFGSVAGRFIAREFPNWEESKPNGLKHTAPGVVSVRRGSDSGFSFTIYPGSKVNPKDLDDNHIVVGQVIEGLDVIEALNETPVVKAAKVNYMGLTGGPNAKDAPTRACLYGGPMYCVSSTIFRSWLEMSKFFSHKQFERIIFTPQNENKPLIKLTMYQTGIL